MKRFFTYLFLIVLLTSVSGANNLILAEVYQIEVDNKCEEKEEASKEVEDVQILQVQNRIIGSTNFASEQSTQVDYEETKACDQYITSAYHSLFILHESFLI